MLADATVTAIYELPEDAAFPESAGVDPATGDAFAGSLANGALYRITRDGRVDVWSAGGEGGRRSMAGVKVDLRGRLWAAGGYDGTLWVYDLASRALIARMDVGSRPSCVNDIAFGPAGEAYVTDSLIPALFQVGGDPLTMRRWVDQLGVVGRGIDCSGSRLVSRRWPGRRRSRSRRGSAGRAARAPAGS
jgi:Cu-Zn family superoxide dismutase